MNLYDYLYKLYIRNKLELKSIYIYIYKSEDLMWENMRFCQVLCIENLNILKCHIRDKNKLNFDLLFHLVQCFKIF